MTIQFKNLEFLIHDNKIFLMKAGAISNPDGANFVEVQVCGENKDTHLGVKMIRSSESARLCYVSHEQTENCLKIVQRSALVETTTVFTAYDDTNTLRVYTSVKNISDAEIVLEEVSAFVVVGLGQKGIDSADELYFTRFTQSHHAECQPRRASFREWGLFRMNIESQKRIAFANVGSWSTKEELPQGIIEDTANGSFTMFQIESNASWYYEIADNIGKYYLYLGSANLPFCGWSKELKPGESYQTVNVALAYGSSLNEVLGEMSKYRRHIAGRNPADKNLPAIFNEYMHLSWDSPSEENTKKYAPVVAKTGVEYYVIDCGWHDEEDANVIYQYLGAWEESKKRFPNGIRATMDYIRSLGMKPGLWIEPEIIGIKCKEMLEYYDDSCFMQRNGKRLAVMNRHFLDYRNEKVRSYMTETIRRMVEDYGAEYIKCDYNQDCGVGTDYLSFCAGEGLEECANAFLSWMREMVARFPNVVFEGCSSGGMRMDYKTLGVYSLISTSDQTNYKNYPYIAGNILSAALPEQAAVWSYPIDTGFGDPNSTFAATPEWVEANISKEQVIVNMINSFLGRMHLASHLELLSEEKFALVQEGVTYYKTLTEAKKQAVPYMPCGFTNMGAESVVAGFKADRKIYLAVWCLKGSTNVRVPIEEGIAKVKLAYPSASTAQFEDNGNELSVVFAKGNGEAAFFEIEVK